MAGFLLMICVVLLLLLAERLIPPVSQSAERRDWAINLQAWGVKLLTIMLVGGSVVSWQGFALVDGAKLPVWLAVLLYLVVFDLAEYLYHRMQHRIPMLWAIHSLHHSDPEMHVLTTNRHYWADDWIKSLTVWLVAGCLISPTPTAVAVYGALSLWNYFTHSRLQLSLGRLSWLVNMPAYHRRHHSRLAEHHNSNFAALLPIWDVIAGDYHKPDGWPPTGLDTRPLNLGELLTWPLHHARGTDESPLPAEVQSTGAT